MQKVLHETHTYNTKKKNGSSFFSSYNDTNSSLLNSFNPNQIKLDPLNFNEPYFEYYYSENQDKKNKEDFFIPDKQEEKEKDTTLVTKKTIPSNEEIIQYIKNDAPFDFPLIFYNCSELENILDCQNISSTPTLIYKTSKSDLHGKLYVGDFTYHQIKPWIQNLL